MNSVKTFQTPDELELLEFFGTEPTDAVPNDGYWSYAFTDANGTTLKFSVNAHERSVQTSVWYAEQESVVLSCEGATSLHVSGNAENAVLRGEFQTEDSQTTLEIRLHPRVSVRWALLVGS